jgi:hypothetical protein
MEDRDDLVGEFIPGAGSMGDGVRLQTVEFVEGVVADCIADEVEDVFRPSGRISLRLVCKGRAAREAVVRLADEAGVGEGLAQQVGREASREVFERAKFWADVDAC